MTRRAGERAETSAVLRDVLDAGTEVVCLVGKAWDRHVTGALRTILAEGISMVYDSVRFCVGEGRRVFFDAEHFFDGYRTNPAFTLAVVLIFLVLAAQFNSFRDPFIILLGSVPLAMFGALLFTFLKMPFGKFFTDSFTTTLNIYSTATASDAATPTSSRSPATSR